MSGYFKEVRELSPTFWTDYRGDIWTTYNSSETDLALDFNHDKFASSRKHTLRGIHGDFKTTKLITCVHGEIYFVVVDNRPGSETFLEWDWWILNDTNKKQILIPPGFGNGHLVLSDKCVFHYKLSYPGEYADVADQFTLKWNDPLIGIEWPIADPILYGRDR